MNRECPSCNKKLRLWQFVVKSTVKCDHCGAKIAFGVLGWVGVAWIVCSLTVVGVYAVPVSVVQMTAKYSLSFCLGLLLLIQSLSILKTKLGVLIGNASPFDACIKVQKSFLRIRCPRCKGNLGPFEVYSWRPLEMFCDRCGTSLVFSDKRLNLAIAADLALLITALAFFGMDGATGNLLLIFLVSAVPFASWIVFILLIDQASVKFKR